VSDTTRTAPDPTRLRLYGRRRGKRLRDSLQAVMDEDLPSVRVHGESFDTGLDPKTLFTGPLTAVWLEIGFGGGEHLAAQAGAHPAVGFIGAEIFENGVASLLRHRRDRGLTNIRVLMDDVREVLPRLGDACLDRVFLLYPDPWPKRRHAKRRFVCPETLDQLARLMPPGAELRIATDHPVYARWVLRQVPNHPAFRWQVAGPADWRVPPPDSVPTRYEDKARKEGRTPMYLSFSRTDKGQGIAP